MKLNFFARIYLAITDFRLYPFIAQKEKFITAFAYFLCFILLTSAILATGVASKIISWSNEFLSVYDNILSNFTIEDGILDVEENINSDFLGVKIFTDDTKLYGDIDFESLNFGDYKMAIFALKDTLVIGNSNVGYVLTKYKDFNINTNKQELYQLLNYYIDSPLFRISITVLIFCGVFTAYFLTKFFNVIAISIMLLFLGFVFRTKYKFKDYMKVAFYLITLPIITEIIALMVTGEVSEYAYITYYLLVYVYMYYAIRALKLDNIIMATQEKIMGMKMNNPFAQNDNSMENIQNKENNLENENKSEDNKENDDANKSE